MKRSLLCATVAAALAAACTMNQNVPDPAPEAAAGAEATAEIRNRSGATVGRARATRLGDSLRVQVEAFNMSPGSYGAHIHAAGRCDSPDFTTAGPHWNPTAQQHGKNNPQGMHKGDLPNLLIGTDGRGSFEITIPGASVRAGSASILDADGSALVFHERADDFRTDPSGNSGARIACGIFA